MRLKIFKSLCLATSALCALPACAEGRRTATPIQHVIVVVGENHTFDNLFATYKPKPGQTVDNLLSKGIVKEDGSPGAHFDLAKQRIGANGPRTGEYNVVTETVGAYATLPQPWTADTFGLGAKHPDARFPANLPNGPYPISKYAPYNSYTGDPAHRFFQMWQQWDGGKNDKFVWVEETIGTGSNGKPYVSTFYPQEGAISMGFFNMAQGDGSVFKSLADAYAMSDNFHQSIMGGTGANFQAIVSGDAAFFTDPVKLDGKAAKPFDNQIENPNPANGTNNYYINDGYAGGSYVACADRSQPGVRAVDEQLRKNGVEKNNCARDVYYLVNNYSMFWNQTSAAPRPLGANKFVLPPQSIPTIADVMTKKGVSWKYYTGDRGTDIAEFPDVFHGGALPFHFYCDICDPLTGYSSIMKTPSEQAKLRPYGDFLRDVANGALPEVAFVRPFEALAGHPTDSNVDLYEKFLQELIAKVQAKPDFWASTAIFITTDEGGGYYDSGYIQPVDFFGDGTRIPFILVSPYAKKGFVDHTYYDHVSMLKFIERNWRLPKISDRSRDNLPNPVAERDNPYRPKNRPAIGDLMNLFTFAHGEDDDHGER